MGILDGFTEAISDGLLDGRLDCPVGAAETTDVGILDGSAEVDIDGILDGC